MKFVISLLFALPAWAAPAWAAPIQIFHEQNSERASIVKSIFTETYKIPEDLIGLLETPKCEELKVRGKLDLCLKNNGDLWVVSVDPGFVSESLKIFYAP